MPNPIEHMKPEYMTPLVTRAKLKKNRLEFIKSEIELGFTFATIARSTRDPDRFERNKRNALRAYDEANRFLRGTSLSVEELEQLEFAIDKLRSALASFGGPSKHAVTFSAYAEVAKHSEENTG